MALYRNSRWRPDCDWQVSLGLAPHPFARWVKRHGIREITIGGAPGRLERDVDCAIEKEIGEQTARLAGAAQ